MGFLIPLNREGCFLGRALGVGPLYIPMTTTDKDYHIVGMRVVFCQVEIVANQGFSFRSPKIET